MSLWTTLKSTIDSTITTNGTNDISGADVRGRLNEMVDSLGSAQFKGGATTATNPPAFEGSQFYIATEAGTYTNFGSLVVAADEIAFLYNPTNSGWSKVSITINADKWQVVDTTKIEPIESAIVTLLLENIDAQTSQLTLKGSHVKIDGLFRDSTNAIGDGTKILGTDTNGNLLFVDQDGNVRYSITTGSVNIQVIATGTGVTASNATGELTIDIPSGVDLKQLHVTLPQSETDATNRYFILFDYTDARSYNTGMDDVNLPTVLIGSTDVTGLARTNPILYSDDGGANVDVGITSIAGGDGSDLEIGIYDFLIDTNQFITLKF